MSVALKPRTLAGLTSLIAGLSLSSAPIAAAGGVATLIYYVDATGGSDSNDGLSPGSAWQTLAKVNAETIPAGAHVLFKGGETFSGELVLREGQHYGEPGNPVVYGSYGAGKATIQATNNAHHGVDLLNPHDVTVQDLICIGTGSAVSTTVGIHARNDLLNDSKLPGLRVQRCEVSGYGKDGIAFRTGDNAYAAGSASGWTSPVIDGCVVHDCTENSGYTDTATYGSGITIQGMWPIAQFGASTTDPLIQNCVVYNCRGNNSVGDQHTGNGILVGEVSGGITQNNLSYNNGELGTLGVGIWVADSIGHVIQFCVARDQKVRPNAPDGGGFDIDGGAQNCIIQYCYSEGNAGSGYQLYQWNGQAWNMGPLSGNIIRYNISLNDGIQNPTLKGGIAMGNEESRDQPDNWIYGNTIYQETVDGSCLHFHPGTNVRFVGGGFFNNILVATNGKLIDTVSGVPAASFLVRGNLYWTEGGPVSLKWGATTYTSIAAWRSATGKETDGGTDTSVSADPLFAGALPLAANVDTVTDGALAAFQTLPGSGARGLGQDILALSGVAPPRDFFGNVVPQNGYDIGCFESDTVTMILQGSPVTSATINSAYAGFTVSAKGGQAPYTYSVASGSLPPGITLDPNTGAVSGTPTMEGAYDGIVLQATDANSQTAQMPAFSILVGSVQPNLMDGISWVPYQAALSIVGNEARFVKDQTASPRGAKNLTGLSVGATYRCIGNVKRGTIANGDGIWFRVTGDQPMTSNKLLELTATTGDVAVNHTFVATVSSVYVGAVGLATGANGPYVVIDDDFRVEYVSG